MSITVLGLDTSNYRTSAALVDEEGNVKADHYYVSVIGGGKADLVFESAVDP